MSSVKLPDWIGDDEVIRRFSDDGKVCKLPPWTGDDRAMLRWLAERLDAMAHVEMAKRFRAETIWNDFTDNDLDNDPYPLGVVRAEIKNVDLPEAIKMANAGNMGPLQSLLVSLTNCLDLAEFIHLPKRRRGQRFPNPFANRNPVLRAALDARRIRALWKKFYSGRRRRRGDKSAEAFAEELWAGWKDGPVVTTAKIENRLKKLRPSK
jgi:hypothetical protein